MTKKTQLSYTHYPHESTQSLIIIHGLLGCKDNWRTLAKTLSQHINVYCIDCRNHGESFHHHCMTYEDMSNDLEQLLDYLCLEKVSVIGHSMGGKIAMHSIQKQPNRYLKAIIVDIAPKTYSHHHQAVLNAMQTLTLSNMMTRTIIDTTLKASIPDAAIRQLLLKNIKRNQSNTFYWQCNHKAIQDNISNIMAHSLTETPIKVPTLFLRGEYSFYIVESKDTMIINHYFKNVHIETIEKAGHWLQTENPQIFLEKALKFLNH